MHQNVHNKFSEATNFPTINQVFSSVNFETGKKLLMSFTILLSRVRARDDNSSTLSNKQTQSDSDGVDSNQ